jgi:hypothetical protein
MAPADTVDSETASGKPIPLGSSEPNLSPSRSAVIGAAIAARPRPAPGREHAPCYVCGPANRARGPQP